MALILLAIGCTIETIVLILILIPCWVNTGPDIYLDCRFCKMTILSRVCRACEGKGRVLVPTKKQLPEINETIPSTEYQTCPICSGIGREPRNHRCGGRSNYYPYDFFSYNEKLHI